MLGSAQNVTELKNTTDAAGSGGIATGTVAERSVG